jgi:hypothetical protein
MEEKGWTKINPDGGTKLQPSSLEPFPTIGVDFGPTFFQKVVF